MIQALTRLRVTDNSGVQEIMCIRVMGRGQTRVGTLGDEIIASAKRVAPNSPVGKGEVVRAIIVRTRAPVGRCCSMRRTSRPARVYSARWPANCGIAGI